MGHADSHEFGSTEFRGGGMLRLDDLHNEQLGAVSLGELRGPSYGLIRRLGTVGPNHDASDGAALKNSFHNPDKPHRR